MTDSDIKFKNPGKIANGFVDIIAPTFGLTKGVKLIVKSRLKLTKDEDLRKCLINVLKFLAVEYKK